MHRSFSTLSDADRRRIHAEFGAQATVAAYVAAVASICAIVLLVVQITRHEPPVQPNEEIQPIVWVNVVTAHVTKYSKAETCPNRTCYTASGIVAGYGNTAACPRKYPIMTVIKIDGVEYVCQDRTARRTDGRFDLWEGSDRGAHARAIKWGNRIKTIIIK